MSYIDLNVNVSLTDVFSEIADDELIDELKSRGYAVKENNKEEKAVNYPGSLPSQYIIPRLFDNHMLREHLLKITGQGHYVTNEQLVENLKELLQ